MSGVRGTSVQVRLERVSDGDTIRIFTPASSKAEAVRILCLDTEESFHVSTKPVTPWGKAAKEFAHSFFAGVEIVTIEFEDNRPLDECLVIHRDLYGRLLVHVWKDKVDFTEVMIRRGFSPYFMKYGHATFSSHRERYIAAERQAQADNLGVWDQVAVNGAIVNNYPALKAWWSLRAAAIDDFRTFRTLDDKLLDSRLDYTTIVKLATERKPATVFAEAKEIRYVTGKHIIVDVGSTAKPFNLVIPAASEDPSNDTVSETAKPSDIRAANLLKSRYIANGLLAPNRGYLFATGMLTLYYGRPQIIVTSSDAISDVPFLRPIDVPDDDKDKSENEKEKESDKPNFDGTIDQDVTPAALPIVVARIASVLPNPEGVDAGNECITIRAVLRPEAAANILVRDTDGTLKATAPSISLDGWRVKDAVGRSLRLSGSVSVDEPHLFKIPPRGGLTLNNGGDKLVLIDAEGRIVHSVSYTALDARPGNVVSFDADILWAWLPTVVVCTLGFADTMMAYPHMIWYTGSLLYLHITNVHVLADLTVL